LENVTFLIEILAVFASLMSIWHAHDYFTNTLPRGIKPGRRICHKMGDNISRALGSIYCVVLSHRRSVNIFPKMLIGGKDE